MVLLPVCFSPSWVWSNLLLKLQFVCPQVSLYALINGFLFDMHHFSLSTHRIFTYQCYTLISMCNCVFVCEQKKRTKIDVTCIQMQTVRRQQIHLAANWEKQLQLRALVLGWDSEIGWIIYIFRALLQFADRFQEKNTASWQAKR